MRMDHLVYTSSHPPNWKSWCMNSGKRRWNEQEERLQALSEEDARDREKKKDNRVDLELPAKSCSSSPRSQFPPRPQEQMSGEVSCGAFPFTFFFFSHAFFSAPSDLLAWRRALLVAVARSHPSPVFHHSCDFAESSVVKMIKRKSTFVHDLHVEPAEGQQRRPVEGSTERTSTEPPDRQ